ncbi:MAG: homoserine O-acetyltransferase [Planctomycetota bacterium]
MPGIRPSQPVVVEAARGVRSGAGEEGARGDQVVKTESVRLVGPADEPFSLELGGGLTEVDIAYETYGTLAPDRDNVVLVCHALTGDAHAAGRHAADDKRPGWWDEAIGPGKVIDTDRFFVVCSNVLGSRYGSTGPCSINPATGEAFGVDFPVITVGDMVRAQALVLDAIGIERVYAVTGGSLGGMQALAWLERFPKRVRRIVPVCAAPRLTAQAQALNHVGRRAVLGELERGDSAGVAAERSGLGVARMLAHISYLSCAGMEERFVREPSPFGGPRSRFDQGYPVETYLDHQAETFAARFDAATYLHLTAAMDRCDIPLDRLDPESDGASPVVRFIAYDTDWLYPPEQSVEAARTLRARGFDADATVVHSSAGHDGFLVDVDAMRDVFERALGAPG